MENLPWTHVLLTLTALLCLVSVWHERSKERLSRRATFLLVCLGPFSWASQMWLLGLIDLGDPILTQRLLWSAVIALACFYIALTLNLLPRVHGRDTTQALIWGQCVFPLVLVTFLPEGNKTLFEALPF